MDKGWISIHRKLKDNWLWQEKRTFSKAEAWIDILLNVNHSEQKVLIKQTLFTVKRGESIMSLDSWSKRWNWNKSTVRRFLKLLEVDGMIVTKNETQTTRLTILNYDSYQSNGNASETQVKRKRNASETEVTPNNNDNNNNNENKIYRSFSHLSISVNDFNKLKLNWSAEQINSIFDKIENYKKNKNYTSLYLTALGWLKKEYPIKEKVEKGKIPQYMLDMAKQNTI